MTFLSFILIVNNGKVKTADMPKLFYHTPVGITTDSLINGVEIATSQLILLEKALKIAFQIGIIYKGKTTVRRCLVLFCAVISPNYDPDKLCVKGIRHIDIFSPL